MSWLYYSLSSVLFFTALNILQRNMSINMRFPRAASFAFNSVAIIMALVFYLIFDLKNKASLPSGINPWLVVLFVSLIYGFFERLRFVIVKLLDASTLTIIGNMTVVVAFIGSVFIYSEKLTINKLLGAILILFSIMLVSINKTKNKNISVKGVVLSVLLFSAMGLGWMMDKTGALYYGASLYNLLIWFFPIFIVYLPSIKLSEIKYEFKNSYLNIVLLSGLNVAGYILQLKA